jgi:hypothetical protein
VKLVCSAITKIERVLALENEIPYSMDCCEYDHSEELEEGENVGSSPHDCSLGRWCWSTAGLLMLER